MFGFIFGGGFFFVNGKLLRVAVFFRTTQWSTRNVSFWKGNLPTEPFKASWIKRTLEFFPWGGGVNHFDFLWLFPPTSTVRWGGTVFRDLDRLEDLVMQTLQTLQDPASMSFFSPTSFHFLSDGKSGGCGSCWVCWGFISSIGSLYFPVWRCFRSALTASPGNPWLSSLLTSVAASLKMTKTRKSRGRKLSR